VPPETPNAQPTQTATVAGAELKLATPKTCVRPGDAFTSTLSSKKQGKGARFVKITRVDFFINDVRVRIDRKAPFSLRFIVENSQRGKTYTVRARAYIKVRRGKAPRKSISVRFQVCST